MRTRIAEAKEVAKPSNVLVIPAMPSKSIITSHITLPTKLDVV